MRSCCCCCAPNCLCVHFSGDIVSFQVSATNTGNLRLKDVVLSLPPRINTTLSCTTSTGAIATSTAITTAAGAAVLEPGSTIRCDASLTATLADMESAPQQLVVQAEGSSVLGALAPLAKQVQLTPRVQPMLAVVILESECIKPTKAGVLCACFTRSFVLHNRHSLYTRTASNMPPFCTAGSTATGLLTCPIQLRNTGNVGLVQINLKSPSTACTAAALEPSAVLNCTGSLAASQADFEQGVMFLSVLAEATPRVAGTQTPFAAKSPLEVRLVKQWQVTVVQATAMPTTVNQAGERVVAGCFAQRGRLQHRVALNVVYVSLALHSCHGCVCATPTFSCLQAPMRRSPTASATLATCG